MRKNKTIYAVFLLLVAQNNFGQTASKQLYGKVTSNSVPVEGVNIVNNSTQVTTVSGSDGNFLLPVKEGEVLVFSAVNLEPLKRRITSNELLTDFLAVEMSVKEIELKEVLVSENTAISAENLGIIPKNQKKYTQAERQLATAGDFKPVMLLGLLGGSMQLDPLINKISGRTKRLKTNVEIEKREKNFAKLGFMFDEIYFINQLQIPKENINEFKFYLVENESFCLAMNSKNKTSTEFLLGELAVKYKEIIAGENK